MSGSTIIGLVLVGAIVFFVGSLSLTALVLAIIGIGIMLFLMWVGVRNFAIYLILMVLVWFGFHESGIHATIAGVIFGLLTPTKSWISEKQLGDIFQRTGHFLRGDGWGDTGERYTTLRQTEIAARKSLSPLERFENELHPWVGFVIMPIFALANAGVSIQVSDITKPVATVVGLGLLAGKPIGIVFFSWLAVKIGLARLPVGINWGAITGGGFLAGIGFTMATFIASLALEGALLDAAKVGILGGSALAGITGVILLILFLPKPSNSEADAGK